MNKKEIKGLLKLFVETLIRSKYFLFGLYPRRISNTSKLGVFDRSQDCEAGSFAVVIQGPLIEEDNFTIETIKAYRYFFPDAIIILSTWNLSDVVKKVLSSHRVIFIENRAPINPGISNINMQIVTSYEGLLMAKKLGATYVLKTRSDQRIYHPSSYSYFRNLLKVFPLKIKNTIQKERIVVTSLGTFKFRIYGVSDMFMFGQLDDVLLYWSAPLDSRNTIKKSKDTKTWYEWAVACVCETYLCVEFLKKLNHKPVFTLKDSFKVISQRFVVIDNESIRLYWNKYSTNIDRYATSNILYPQISFNDWLMMFQDIHSLNVDWNIINQPIVQGS